MPVLSLAAAEDMTQRRPNPCFIRASATSSQGMHALADYAAKELKYKRVITLADDFAFGHEQMAGFQRVFEDAGGRVVKKLWAPLVTPDYPPYIAPINGGPSLFPHPPPASDRKSPSLNSAPVPPSPSAVRLDKSKP